MKSRRFGKKALIFVLKQKHSRYFGWIQPWFWFIFHTTNEHRHKLKDQIDSEELKECDVISDEKFKSYVLKKSIFAVTKSGTISLEVCNAKVPSVIIYK